MEHKDTANLSSYLSLKKAQNPWLKTNVIMPARLMDMKNTPSILRRIQNGIFNLVRLKVNLYG